MRLLACLLVALGLLGCGGAKLLSQEAVSRVEPGLTTRQQALAWFGEPDGVEGDASGSATWTYVRSSRWRGSQATSRWALAPLVDLSDVLVLYFPPSTRRESVHRDVLELSFGPDGVLRTWSYERVAPDSVVRSDPSRI